ncbi:MAG TPA: hypothetical protein VHU41_17260, partial [Thermoanaerobaculia bacterium]|nr:hypothetical protein [Thermoanaerobaculia bacterium]
MIRRFVPFALLIVAMPVFAQVSVVVTIPTIDPGLPFEIAVAVQNLSGADLKGLTSVVEIPPGARVAGLPSTCTESGQTVTCLIADLPYVLSLPQKTFGITAIADDSTNGTVLPISVDVRGPTGTPLTNQTIDAKVYRTI